MDKNIFCARILSRAIFIVPALFASAAFAEDLRPATKPVPTSWDWSNCKAEINKSCADVASKGNEAIYVCLFQHDSLNSKDCDAVHTQYETATGRAEGPPKN